MPIIEKSVTHLGFKFSDTKILLGNHAHGDHQEGDALVKQKTGAQVMAMAEDVPALQALKPGGKEHPIDKVLHDGDKVTLGGTTLVAHLTAGHTRGCTTWTTTAQEGGKTYNVMFGCSLRPPAVVTPALVDEFNRSFKTGAGASLRRPARRSRRPVQHAGEIREAQRRRSESVHRSRELHARGGRRGGHVPRDPGRAAATRASVARHEAAPVGGLAIASRHSFLCDCAIARPHNAPMHRKSAVGALTRMSAGC